MFSGSCTMNCQVLPVQYTYAYNRGYVLWDVCALRYPQGTEG